MTAATPAPRRRGRRPAGEDTRGAIVAAAREQFAARGYEAVTLRAIARAAGVDPRLVHHYFDGKEEVFVEAVGFPVRPKTVVEGVLGSGPDGVGERLARAFFAAWDGPSQRERVVALLSAVLASPEAAAMLREFVTREILLRVAGELGGDRPELRAAMCGAQMIGVAMVRYVVRIEPVASADVEELVRLLAPTLQRYLTADLTGELAGGPAGGDRA